MRRAGRAFGIFLCGTGFLLSLQAVATLVQGLPTYLNAYRLPVSAHVALAIGIVLFGAGLRYAIHPPKERGQSGRRPRPRSGRIAPAAAAELPGRNAPCPCGSGRKFKHCCRGDEEERRRREARHRSAAAANRANEVTGGTSMANRGLRGR